MICPNDYCGAEVGDDAARCQLCGTGLVTSDPRDRVEGDRDGEARAALEGPTSHGAAGLLPSGETGAGTPALAPPVERQLAPAVERWPFEFTGDTTEYFRIWVVNLAFTLVTLGIYSAWAKVRTTRYFYGNTRVAGASFEYLANPVAILKGRLLAAVLFGLYWFAGDIVVASWILSLGFTVVFPWMVVRGLAFRAHNSTYRNIRFRFTGAYREANVAYLFRPILAFVTLGLIYPLVRWHQQRFVTDHAQLGTTQFRFGATSEQFIELYVKGTIFVLFGGLVAALAFVMRVWGIGLLALVFMWYAWFDFSASFQNLVYNRSELGPHRLESTLDGRSLFWLHLVNSVAMLASLGLLIPWVRIRTARYRAARLVVAAPAGLAGLDGIVAAPAVGVSAAGSEVAEIFDVDIGF